MKYLIIALVLVAIMLSSCTTEFVPYEEYADWDHVKGDPINKPWLNEPSQISAWVHTNIKYKRDIASKNEGEWVQTAQETIDMGTGDCEDLSFLYLALCKKYLNITGYAKEYTEHISATVHGVDFDQSDKSDFIKNISYSDIQDYFYKVNNPYRIRR